MFDLVKSGFSCLKEKLCAAWERWRALASETQTKIKEDLGGFLTSPLSEAEYALLKRVSGIVGTAVTVYLIFSAGPGTALAVCGLCLCLLFGLYKFNPPPPEAQN
jgi:hypothetical protein